MGIVLPTGISGAVNVLLLSVSRMIAQMAAPNLLPSFLGRNEKRAFIPLIMLSAGIALMMGTGMAGSSFLDLYIYGGLLFWLLNYAAVNLSLLFIGRVMPEEYQRVKSPGYLILPFFAFLTLSLGVIGLLLSGSDTGLLIKFLTSIIFILAIFGFFWTGHIRRKHST